MDQATVQIHIFADNIIPSDLPGILRAIEKHLGKRGEHQDLIMYTMIEDIHYNLGKLYGKDIIMFKNDHKYICKHG